MIERITAIMKSANQILIAVFLSVCIMAIQEGRIWVPIFVQAVQDQSTAALVRTARAEAVMAGPFGALKRWIQPLAPEVKKNPYIGLPGLTKAIVENTGKLGGAAEELGKTSNAATDTIKEAKTTLTNASGLFTEATSTVKSAGLVMTDFHKYLNSPEMTNSFKNVAAILEDVHGITAKVNAELDPANPKSLMTGLHKSKDDVNSMTMDTKFWVHRQTAKPKLITTLLQNGFNYSLKALTAARGY